MLPIRTILHPTDLSVESKSAFLYACAMSRDYGARLILLTVYPPSMWCEISNDRGGQQATAEELLAKLHQLNPDPLIKVDYRVVKGRPVDMILAVAEEFCADLIVMATYGGSGPLHQVMGSVTEAVNRGAFCPVVTVRTEVKLPPKIQPASK